MKIIFILGVLILFVISWIYFFREGKFSNTDMIAIAALVVSVTVGCVTMLSNSMPPHVILKDFDFTILGLPEENRIELLQQGLWEDISQGLTQQGSQLAAGIKKQFGIQDIPRIREKFVDLCKDYKFDYVLSDEVAKRFIGRRPYSMPIIIGCSFINDSPNQALITEVLLVLEGPNGKFIYKPKFIIDGSKFYSFKKMVDLFKGSFHPFLLPGKSEIANHLLFIKYWSCGLDGKQDDNLEIGVGQYKLKLCYMFSDREKTSQLKDFVFNEDLLLRLRSGGATIIDQEAALEKKLKEEISRN